MELRHLRHFLAVADELHMGRAAERLGMAQPPLSRSIARLERLLGVRLFDRTHRRLGLTRAGAAFLEEARTALQHVEVAGALARGVAAGTTGPLRIGFVSAALYAFLPALLGELHHRHPAIQPGLREMSTNEQLAAIEAGDLDLGFCHPPLARTRRIERLVLPAEDLVAVLPDDGGNGSVSLEELARRGLILFPSEQGPVLRAQILDAFDIAGHPPHIVQDANRAVTMLALVSAGLGAALLPRSTRRIAWHGVRYAEIEDMTLPSFAQALIAPRRPRAPVIETALDIAKKLFPAKP